MNFDFRIFDRWTMKYVKETRECGMPAVLPDGKIVFLFERVKKNHYVINTDHDRYGIEPYIKRDDINNHKCYLNDLIDYKNALWIILEDKEWGYHMKRLNHIHYLNIPEEFEIVNTIWEYMRKKK